MISAPIGFHVTNRKCPRAFTARRMREFTLSMLLVVQITDRISLSKARKGTNSAHALSHSWMIAG
jgi:hypothetical protein